MRLGPRERLLLFGITQTVLLSAVLLGEGWVPERARFAGGLAFSGGLAAILFLLPLLLEEGGRGRLDRWIVAALAAVAAYAPVGLALALRDGGAGELRTLAPAIAVVAVVVLLLRARLTSPAAEPLARLAFGAFGATVLLGVVMGPPPLALASLLVQVVVVIRLLVRVSGTRPGRRVDAAVFIANPFVPGVALMVVTGALAVSRGDAVRLDPTPELLVGALAISWLLPGLLLTGGSVPARRA